MLFSLQKLAVITPKVFNLEDSYLLLITSSNTHSGWFYRGLCCTYY